MGLSIILLVLEMFFLDGLDPIPIFGRTTGQVINHFAFYSPVYLDMMLHQWPLFWHQGELVFISLGLSRPFMYREGDFGGCCLASSAKGVPFCRERFLRVCSLARPHGFPVALFFFSSLFTC